ncbi:MAG: serine protein kinase PrkA [Desulfobacteraceae bacterium]|nr:serine protein kinase PrkA [Desulfobacteraceae bacterium]
MEEPTTIPETDKPETVLGEQIEDAMNRFDQSLKERHQHPSYTFEQFLQLLLERPRSIIRNVFQVFHDMVTSYVGEGYDEYPDDPESIHFVLFDCSELLVDETDHPFFADRLFANRFMDHVAALRRGAQQNKIYIFDGPPGCGKSTFLNNLLMKFEEYSKTQEGLRYETLWRLDRQELCRYVRGEPMPLYDKVIQLLDTVPDKGEDALEPPGDPCQLPLPDASVGGSGPGGADYIEVPCPSHDHPILMIPKHYRRQFFDDLFLNDEFKWKLFTDKEYDWVFKEQPCTICSSIYWALMNRLKSPRRVFRMLYAKPYIFSRRLGEGISVFNPGDKPMRQNVLSNSMLQNRMNALLRDSNQVRYIFSRYAKTNNGIYALMDIKSHNVERLIELHNIISEGVHKVEDQEEYVNSLLMALMNPEDKKNIQEFQSFSDRIEYIHIPYVLDLNTEVNIYRNIFGKHIDESFLPRVLHNFARVILSSRVNPRSDALLEWIGDPAKYRRYCDDNLLLLKMEIYTGHIPSWLSDEDRRRFTANRRRNIIAESKAEGDKGLSGRDSLKIFNEFYAKYAREDRLIDMSTLCVFFTKVRKDLNEFIPPGFLDSLLHMYDYTVLEEVKESMFDTNEEQISRQLRNYLFAINFEVGASVTSRYTGDKLDVSDAFFEGIEKNLLQPDATAKQRVEFRKATQKAYATGTLTQEMMVDGKPLEETLLYEQLHERYIHNLKERVLDPFLENENFRQAVKDYGLEGFKTYDRRIRQEVAFLMRNLCDISRYTEQGAKEACIYVIDNDLARRFGPESKS